MSSSSLRNVAWRQTTPPFGAGCSVNGPELEERLRRHLKPTNKSWRVDETYVRVKGRWCYLYRAIDSAGATIDFLLSAFRDADVAKHLFRKALNHPSHPQPRVINTDLALIYGSAIPDIKKDGVLRRRCRHRPAQYLNNILEQDHRAIKRRVNAKQGFREFQAAQRTIQGYEDEVTKLDYLLALLAQCPQTDAARVAGKNIQEAQQYLAVAMYAEYVQGLELARRAAGEIANGAIRERVEGMIAALIGVAETI
jgi:transposase-like protein